MYPDLQSRGFAVAAIGISDLAQAEKIETIFKSPFPILADPDRQAFGAYAFGRLAFLLQRSGTVIIKRGGRIHTLHRAVQPQKSLDRTALDAAVDEIAGPVV